MNAYEDLKQIHALAQQAIVIFDSGEEPGRALIAHIREIAGAFPKYGTDNEYLGWARSRHRGDNGQAYLSLCDSDAEGAFKIYRHPKAQPSLPVEAAWPMTTEYLKANRDLPMALRFVRQYSDEVWRLCQLGHLNSRSKLADITLDARAFLDDLSDKLEVPAPPADTAHCKRCRGTKTISFKVGQTFETDSADEIMDAYRTRPCPGCVQPPADTAPRYDKARNWAEDAGHENGNYHNRCIHCHQMFVGHKRRVACKACCVQPPADTREPAHCEGCRLGTCPGLPGKPAEPVREWRVAWNDSSGHLLVNPGLSLCDAEDTEIGLLERGGTRYQNVRKQFSIDGGINWRDANTSAAEGTKE